VPAGAAYYVVAETLRSEPDKDGERFEEILGQAFEEGLISDAVLAKSQSERNAIWEIRDDVLDLFHLGPLIPYDISVTLDKMEAFVTDVRTAMQRYDDPICVIFGHLGDCNLHVILGSKLAEQFDPAALESLLYEIVERYQGSVSAEHGVGLAKRDHLHCSRSEEELALMRRMKRMLDPDNILNPNKIFTADQVSAA
jgi:FAD/FMN-containing dehydrogenase